MFQLVFSHLGSIGLLIDIIGASILFFTTVTIGEQVILIDESEERLRKKKKARKELILKIGYGLILIGFILQFVASEGSE